MKTHTDGTVGNGGFTLVQLVTVISIIGIIAGTMVRMYSNLPGSVARHKLTSDVRSINAAIDIYRTFGGNLANADTAEEVIAKLQTRADAISAEETAGLTGNLIDRRLKPVMLAESEAESGRERAVWNSSEQRFMVTTEGDGGVESFEIDDTLAGEMVVVESRQQNLKLASANGWIWDYDDHGAGSGPGPTQILNVYAGNNGPGTPFGGGPPGGGGGGSNPDALPLDPPAFSIPEGSYLITDYDMALTLDNPNPGGVSRIIYRVDSGAWSAYNGTAINVAPESVVLAFAESIDPDWLNSANAENAYDVTPAKLDEPLIVSNAIKFDVGGYETVEVTINNSNSVEVSSLEYKLSGGGWEPYGGETLELNVYDYPEGVTVRARAIATAMYYLDSDNATLQVEEPDPVTLASPTIAKSAPKFDYDSNANVEVTLTNPNDPAVSAMEYRVDDSPWEAYSGAVTLNVMDHQVQPAIIQARAVTTDPFYEDSAVVGDAIIEPDPLFTISGDSDGEFTNAVGGSNMVTNLATGSSNPYFEWGDGAWSSDPSSLLFQGDNFVDVSQGERFVLGTLDYYNGTIWSGTGADSVDLDVDLAFYDGVGMNNFEFTINLLNTVNTSNQWESADYVKLINVYSESTTTIAGRDYQLRLEFGETTEDGFSLLDEFHVLEDATATGWLYGTLWLVE